MNLSKKLKTLRKKHNITQEGLANIIGVERSTIGKYETGTIPSVEILTLIANYFNVSIDYLTGNNTNRSETNAIRIPVFGHVAAGIPIDAIEDILDYEEMSADDAQGGEYFALKIKGNSMEPRIYDGDVVIVRRQPDINNGEIAIVLINGDEATCKKIKKTPQGVMLISLNPDYEPMFYTKEEVINLPITILGKVEEVRGKLRRI